MQTLLYGHNPEERIVAVHQLNDQTVRLFKRVEGKILHKDVEFFPFFFLADEKLIKDFPKKFWLKELTGNNYYRFIAAFTRWSDMWEAIHFILREYNKTHSPRVSSYQELKEILVRTDAVRQFLLQSGITLFKGMEFDELVSLHIDVQFAPASVKKHGIKSTEEHIFVITLSTSDGNEYILSGIKLDEREIIDQCIKRINEIDPDIIEGYDLFGTILPAISRACERQQVSFAIGRDGSDMRIPSGHGTIGFGENEWFAFDVFGRHLIDLLTLAETEMDFKRVGQSFNLISIAKHFGITVGDEHTIPAQHILDEWKREPQNVVNQSLRNVRIVHNLYRRFSPSLFYLAQICPLNYHMLLQLSPTSHIESLMLREYVRQKHSIPKPFEGSRSVSIPAEIFYTGVFSDIMYVELEGLHSSIILSQHARPKTDDLNVFLSLLAQFSTLQKEILGQTIKNQLHNFNVAAQINVLKRLLHSFHLYLGSAKGLFNDLDIAELVNTLSRKILKEIERQIELFNGIILQSDGEGFFLLAPDNIVGEANQKNFVERISNTLPEGINFVLSHRYKKMFSYRKRNYALMNQNDNVIIKGNSLISRGMEQYLKVFIRRFIECLLTNDLKRLHHAYVFAYTQITKHQWNPLDFCKTDIVKIDTEIYQNEVAANRIPPSPAIEAAIRSSLFVKANSRISYYITGSETEANVALSSRLIEEWDINLPDENTAYYLARLHDAANKFREFFESTAFERILSLDDIFGFSDEGIQILTRKVAQETTETKSDAEDYSIWLSETE